MKLVILILFLFVCHAAIGQHKLNVTLKRQMDSVIVLDQKYREALTFLMEPSKRDSVAKSVSLSIAHAMNYYWKLQHHLDSMNIDFVEQVFKKFGYPGKTLVGEPTNEAAWNVIQHSSKIDKYLPIIKKAADKGELPYRLYAMMLDRQLSNHGKEQIYGTQASCLPLKNGKDIGWYIWPIKDVANVNARRKKAGFDQTVEQNAKRMDVDYKVITIAEVR
ncbi:hypothetical protein SAMN05428975_5063 [Mucilaginibacter sp. OK268]|uniref:DUF6624 domain-containing protein n=1 Tax=Mucilaginibacter sp. OK268 TaxID=1881048 RepID=UPI00087E855D|nr:DUF6624 domain-containing protein [Mucilaginibacter sp. OK268]SDP99554.1 hypothetical protein SAMN05428975_5063 [Mucilaginibacter sp. OK268]